MHSIITRRAPGLAVAATALTMLLAGSAQALPGKKSVDRGDLQNNVVRSKHIVDGQVKGVDVALGAIGSDQVADESLTGQDVKNDSLTGDDVQESSLKGLMAGQVRVVFRQGPVVPGPAGGYPSEVNVDCPTGTKGIGGGGAWIIPQLNNGNDPTALNAPLTASMPRPSTEGTDNITGWRVAGRNMSGVDRALRAYAICVPTQIP